MKKQISIMLAALLMVPVISMAADTGTMGPGNGKVGRMMGDMSVDQRIQMHTDMIKLHQDAIDCLKAGTKPMECGKNFKMGMEQLRTKYFPNAKKGMMDRSMMQQ